MSEKDNQQPVIMSVHGSRLLDGSRVLEIIDAEVKEHNPEYIVTHAEPSGVCKKAREYCRKNSIPLKLHFWNREKYGRGAFHYRSLAVIKECNYCLFIHDGQSKGTKNEMEMAKKLNKPYKYYQIEDEGVEPDFEIPEFDNLLLELQDDEE